MWFRQCLSKTQRGWRGGEEKEKRRDKKCREWEKKDEKRKTSKKRQEFREGEMRVERR